MRIIIDGKACEAEYGEYILTVAKRNGIDIPTLCNSEALPGMGSCRLCVVELTERNRTKVVASCIYPITREAEVVTNSPKITGIRKSIMRLLLSRSPGNVYLNSIAGKYGLMPSTVIEQPEKPDDCILCGLCAKACEELGVSAISTVGRGKWKRVSTPYDEPSAVCVGCGSCAAVCPTGAIKLEENGGIRTIWGKAFELLKCESCGRYYAPREYIEFVEKKLGAKQDAHYCEKCRKASNASKFCEVYKI